MNEKTADEILRICDKFLRIPCVIEHEQHFLKYLEGKIKKMGYKTILKKNYLVVKPKNNVKSNLIFSAHVDRHGLIKNKNKEVEHLGFYLKKKKEMKFKRDDIAELENEFVKWFNGSQIIYKAQLVGEFIRITSHQDFELKFTRQGMDTFFEKVGLRHVREDISSFDKITGRILNNFQTTRCDVDVSKKLVSFDLDEKLNNEDHVFMLNSKINVNENMFSGQIDNVISVAVLYYLLENTDFEQEVIFTTKEEIGLSYNCVLSYLKNKENLKLIVLDTSPYTSFKGKEKGFLTLRYGDENGGFDLELVEDIKKTLIKKKIPYDFKPSFIGMTELGRVSAESKGKIKGTTLQLPSLNYHTTYETSTLESLGNYLEIVEHLCKK